jgi:hypothetical protein
MVDIVVNDVQVFAVIMLHIVNLKGRGITMNYRKQQTNYTFVNKLFFQRFVESSYSVGKMWVLKTVLFQYFH